MIISESELLNRMSPERLRHTLSCAESAVKLAERHGADEKYALDAALLHDITRDLSFKNQLKICREHDIILSDIHKKSPALLHAITGSVIAKTEFSAPDPVCDAIRWHTTGRAGMTLLEKIIWVADFIEPGRTGEHVKAVRDAAFSDIDRALLLGIDATIRYLILKSGYIDTDTVEARNEVLKTRKELF
ncbi:MAG: HD domain-containing protein [Clostridiales bacterium]|nr:HD domain-containing protein [Clostridiales bacterium]